MRNLYEFRRAGLFFALRHTPLFPARTNTRVCIPARCFTKCTHCTGLITPHGGRTSSFGAGNAPHRDVACFTRRYEKKKKKGNDEESWSSAETPRRIGYNYHSMLGSSQSATVPPRLSQRCFAIKTARQSLRRVQSREMPYRKIYLTSQ